jgi:hypothetical protein
LNTGGDEVMLRQIRFHCGGVATSAAAFVYIWPYVFRVSNYAENSECTYCVSWGGVNRQRRQTKRNDQKARQDSQHLGWHLEYEVLPMKPA